MSDDTALDIEQLRLDVYGHLRTTGRLPSRTDLARARQISEATLDAGLRELAARRHVALDAHGDVELAHPFATRDFHFSVKSDEVLWWGGCAWDAFAIPHLVPEASPALIATVCPQCGSPHAWNVSAAAAPPGDQLVHFLVPMAHVWDDVVHACENQSIFCDATCLHAWLEQSGNQLGATFDIRTLWNLASRWYEGRFDYGYRRREPDEAANYFASVGLRGAFWGSRP